MSIFGSGLSTVPSFGGYATQPGELQGIGFWPRVGARVIDLITHYIVASCSGFLFGLLLAIASGGHIPLVVAVKLRHTGVVGFVCALCGAFSYHFITTAVHGSTLGKRILSLVVVQEDGSPCRYKASFIRELAYYVDSLFFGLIAYLEMQKSPKEQRHGDNWAHTIVCKRSDVAAGSLRGNGQFFMALMFGFIADACFILFGLLVVLNS